MAVAAGASPRGPEKGMTVKSSRERRQHLLTSNDAWTKQSSQTGLKVGPPPGTCLLHTTHHDAFKLGNMHVCVRGFFLPLWTRLCDTRPNLCDEITGEEIYNCLDALGSSLQRVKVGGGRGGGGGGGAQCTVLSWPNLVWQQTADFTFTTSAPRLLRADTCGEIQGGIGGSEGRHVERAVFLKRSHIELVPISKDTVL